MAVGVRAFDSAGQPTESLLDLEVLDDTEAPVVGMATPQQDLELFPNESFEVAGTATDDYYVAELSAVFVTELGEEIKVDWESFTRVDRVEQIHIPNPGTLGAILAAEKIYTDYKARVRIPSGFKSHIGEALKF